MPNGLFIPRRGTVIDELRFLREWAGNPLKTGAVSPSGRWLAAAMAAEVDPAGEEPVVELGPGTGVFTRALIERGVAPERLTLVEYSEEFCNLLAARFPRVRVVRGDAYALRDHLEALGVARVGAIVSGLPLLSRPMTRRVELVEAAIEALIPGAPFVQFTYGPHAPVPAAPGKYGPRRGRRVLLNLPPATVWIYSRAGSIRGRDPLLRTIPGPRRGSSRG